MIAKSFLEGFAQDKGSGKLNFDDSALQALEAYDWPGNVRELESKIKRAVIMADGQHITAEDLQLGDVIADGVDRLPLNLRQVREEAERGAIVRALYLAGDNISEASELLGVTRPTLYSIMEKYNLRN